MCNQTLGIDFFETVNFIQSLNTSSMFACWFQPGLISQPTMFFSHNKPAPVGLISPETNQQTSSR